MNRVLLSFFFFVMAFTASSQRLYFIYLQTESQQPFFVKMGEKLNSSTASGYLILSHLRDSVYNFTIGFPGNQVTEQQFSCTINKKDHGFLVKNFGDKGWGLVDLQTSAIQMAAGEKKDLSLTNVPVNAFTDLLAKAADDPTLKQKVILPDEKPPQVVAQLPAKKEEVKDTAVAKKDISKTETVSMPVIETGLKKEETKKDVKPDTANAVAKNIPPKEDVKKNIKQDTTNAIAKNISKKEEQKKDVKQDTANAVVKNIPPKEDVKKNIRQDPASGVVKNSSKKEDPKQTKPLPDTIAKAEEKKREETKIEDSKVQEPPPPAPETYVRTKVIRKSESSTTDGFGIVYIDIQPDGKQDTIRILIPGNDYNVQLTTNKPKDTVADKVEPTIENNNAAASNTVAVKAAVKNNCRQIASDDEFYKLRKKMAGGRSDASMMDEANKVFKTRCFTTTQIKNLGILFIGDGGRYNFFDVAYAHVSDAENFATLQSELKDEYFINRFKAMLR